MKNLVVLSILLCLILLSGCTAFLTTGGEHTFEAIIIELSGTSALVEPDEGSVECKSSDRISFSTNGLDDIGVSAGGRVSVTYTGEIMESYPAQIRAVSWELTDSGKDTASREKTKEITEMENTEEYLEISCPPPLIFGTGEYSYTLISSGGSRQYKNKFGKWQGYAVDIAHTLAPSRTLAGLPYESEYTIKFDSDIQPDKITVMCWNSSDIDPDDIYSAPYENMELSGNTFTPRNDGEYVYEIIAQWSDTGSTYNGMGCYMFIVISNNEKYPAQYINQTTYQSVYDGADMTAVINTKNELENYRSKYKAIFNFTHREASTESDGATIGLLDAFEEYDEVYFQERSLIITAFYEPTISKTHEVSGIYDNGVIFINRYGQLIEGLIIQSWHIIIEVDKNYPPLVSNVPLKIAFRNVYKLPQIKSVVSN